jgi:uncharacterized protein YecT (DUF1311 family)
MMTRMALTALFFAFIFASPAHAQDEDIKCNANGNTLEMAACLQADFKKADRGLNAAYKKAVAALSAADKEYGADENDSRVKRLQEAQRAWIGWRDKECALQSVGDFGGSIERIDIPACRTNLTIDRTKTLSALSGQ